MSPLFNVFIFNSKGECLLYHEFERCDNLDRERLDELSSLTYGFLWQMKRFTGKLSANESPDSFSFVTSKFRFNFFESPTGYKFIINSSLDAPSLCDFLRRDVYAKLFYASVMNDAPSSAALRSSSFVNDLREAFESRFVSGASSANVNRLLDKL